MSKEALKIIINTANAVVNEGGAKILVDALTSAAGEKGSFQLERNGKLITLDTEKVNAPELINFVLHQIVATTEFNSEADEIRFYSMIRKAIVWLQNYFMHAKCEETSFYKEETNGAYIMIVAKS